MKADYKNWVPKGMIFALVGGVAVLFAGLMLLIICTDASWTPRLPLIVILAAAFCACSAFAGWSITAYRAFSYNGKRRLSQQIVEGTAAYVTLPEGGLGLDVGCGSGALTIACAKRNRQGTMVGIDRWGKEYASFSLRLCEQNAEVEGVKNIRFQCGDAVRLNFPDGSFDAVTSNYVYHNISGADKQKLILETLRVLKKGGVFAIHDLMSPTRYGNMEAFVHELKAKGFEEVKMIDTTDDLFMSRQEARRLMLSGSALLIGRK